MTPLGPWTNTTDARCVSVFFDHSVFSAWPGHTYFLGSCGVALTVAVLHCSVRRLASCYRVACVGRIGVLKHNMDISDIEGPLKIYEDDYRRIRSSNDQKVDKIVDLSSLGVVDLNTSIVPDVFGLRAFDVAATPMDFHDIVLDDLSGTLDFRARQIVRSDVTSLKRRWPSVLFQTMHKCRAEMEYLCRACRQQHDSEFGGGRAGTCPHCGVYVISNLA